MIWNVRGAVKHTAPVVLLALVVIFGQSLWAYCTADYEPLRVVRFNVEPNKVHIGDVATLLDGVCNNSDHPVPAQLHLGAQKSNSASVTVVIIDLLRNTDGSIVKDTPELRLRRTFDPGCTVTDPIRAPIPETFTPGMWTLRLHIVGTGPNGEIQDITRTSNEFEVLPHQ